MKRIRFVFVRVFLVLYITTSTMLEASYLQRLINYNSRGPFIAVFYDNINPLYDDGEVIVPEITSIPPPHDQALYNFLHVLRSTQDNEDVDPEAARTFEKTENILRQALRQRCNIFTQCINECPPKKKFTCTFSCKEEYDNLDLCQKPKKCYKPKCGKTMPPYWRL